jgi:hypothetical protein
MFGAFMFVRQIGNDCAQQATLDVTAPSPVKVNVQPRSQLPVRH